MAIPKDLSEKYIPNLGDLHVIGASGLGVCAVDATIGCNTAMTDAELIAAPSNVDGSTAYGAVVHSLGVAPSLSFAVPMITGGDVTGLVNGAQLMFMTANASASFFRARSFTGAAPAGVAAKIVHVR